MVSSHAKSNSPNFPEAAHRINRHFRYHFALPATLFMVTKPLLAKTFDSVFSTGLPQNPTGTFGVQAKAVMVMSGRFTTPARLNTRCVNAKPGIVTVKLLISPSAEVMQHAPRAPIRVSAVERDVNFTDVRPRGYRSEEERPQRCRSCRVGYVIRGRHRAVAGDHDYIGVCGRS